MKPRILHLSADYPDLFQPAKTKAISGLVEGTADQFNHLVVSLNRQGGLAGLITPGRVLDQTLTGSLMALRYAGPPAAVALFPTMARLADFLVNQLEQRQFRPDLIQAHKLTVEGVLAQRLSRLLRVPFVVTMQGNTDQKLMRQRPDRRASVRKIWREARAVMAFAPWTAEWGNALFGMPSQPVTITPCHLPHDQILAPSQVQMVARTAFNLDFWRNKNLAVLLAALRQLRKAFPELILEIAGSGSPSSIAAIERQIAISGVADRTRLVGPIVSEEIQAWLNAATVFALPSRRESFGMVFAEALLAGTPVIYPRGAAIDGFFNDSTFASAITATSVDDVAASLTRLLSNPQTAKADLAKAQAEGALDQFRREKILNAYAKFLAGAVN